MQDLLKFGSSGGYRPFMTSHIDPSQYCAKCGGLVEVEVAVSLYFYLF